MPANRENSSLIIMYSFPPSTVRTLLGQQNSVQLAYLLVCG